MTSLRVSNGDEEDDGFDLVIRFSASLPDLILTIPPKPPPNTATLKQEIRTHLPSDYQQRRIRLIHAGKALSDDAFLSSTLRRSSSQTPSRTTTPTLGASNGAAKDGKGKNPIRNPPSTSRIYIHCSIGEVAHSSADLTAEKLLARRHDSPAAGDISLPPTTPTAIAAPRGFDRLLNAGFTPQEVANLRLQFRAIQAQTHTPDDMPSPNTQRDLEDRWLDNSSTATGREHGQGRSDDDTAGQLDDIIWGSIAGFFWPIGVMLWAGREEGIWTRQRKMAVVVGVLVNLGLGIVRWMR